MKIHGHDKPVIELWHAWNNGSYQYHPVKGSLFSQNVIVDLQGVARKLNITRLGTLSDSAVLFFDKSATFPRYKLAESNYKRCIKVEKADFIVIGKDVEKNIKNTWGVYLVYEDAENLYIARSIRDTKTAISNMYPSAKLIYEGPVVCYPETASIILSSVKTPLVFDSDLDKKVNKTLPVLTYDDAEQIISMLSSTDGSTIELGVKLLSSFDCTSTPLTVKTILCMNPSWASRPVATQVATQTMLDSIKLDKSYIRYGSGLSILMKDTNTYSEDDSVLARKILKPCVVKYLKHLVRRELSVLEGGHFNFKIDITVD